MAEIHWKDSSMINIEWRLRKCYWKTHTDWSCKVWLAIIPGIISDYHNGLSEKEARAMCRRRNREMGVFEFRIAPKKKSRKILTRA
jgi:hypothetical protein